MFWRERRPTFTVTDRTEGKCLTTALIPRRVAGSGLLAINPRSTGLSRIERSRCLTLRAASGAAASILRSSGLQISAVMAVTGSGANLLK